MPKAKVLQITAKHPERFQIAIEKRGHMNGQATTESVEAWINDFMTRLELLVSIEHSVVSQDGTETESNIICFPTGR